MLTIDPTISGGALLNALVLLIGFTVAFTRIGGRLDLLTQRLGAVEFIVASAQDVNSRLAVIETRQGTHGQMIAGVQGKVEELAHGHGWVQRPSGIDREYP